MGISTGNPWADEQINAASETLANLWRNPRAMQQLAGDNDLNPNPSRLQFRIKLLEDRCDAQDKIIAALQSRLR